MLTFSQFIVENMEDEDRFDHARNPYHKILKKNGFMFIKTDHRQNRFIKHHYEHPAHRRSHVIVQQEIGPRIQEAVTISIQPNDIRDKKGRQLLDDQHEDGMGRVRGQTFRYDRGKGARALARQRVGQPPSKKVITPKPLKKPRHKERYDD